MNDTDDKAYIGDGVYVKFSTPYQQLVLTTENGVETTNTIYLEEFIFNELVIYANQHGWGKK